MKDKKIVESVKDLITNFVASGDTKDLISGIGSLIQTEIDGDEVIALIKQQIDDVDVHDLLDTEFMGDREEDDGDGEEEEGDQRGDEDDDRKRGYEYEDSGRRRGDEYED